MGQLAKVLMIIGPGILVAATGVGGADLANGSFAGSALGIALLWTMLVGASLKYVMVEGIARWQLATESSLLEGVAYRLGRGAMWIFLPYLLLWSFITGVSTMSSCGIALHAILPIFANPEHGKVFFAIISSLIGFTIVSKGDFHLFEKVMGVAIAIMFVTVVTTAVLVWPGTVPFFTGLLIPTIPDFYGEGLTWTIALIGGVGGTVTVLCYGYWMREAGRISKDDLTICRIDIATGYALTAIFGLAAMVIGSTVDIQGSGADVLVTLSRQLEGLLGPLGKWLFLFGAACAVFSTLLGCWQAVPYIFADVWNLIQHPPNKDAPPRIVVDTSSKPYRYYLIALATIPMMGLFTGYRDILIIYAVTGAFFFPLLALALLLLNSREEWVTLELKNRLPSMLALAGTLVFFLWAAIEKLS